MPEGHNKIQTIVHLVQSFDPAIGGSLVVAQALAKAQRALGFHALTLSLYASPHDQCDAEQNMTLGVPRSRRWTSGIVRLRSTLAKLGPDVIHHHDGTLWPRLATLGAAPCVVVHGHLGAPAKKCSAAWVTHRLVSGSVSGVVAISDWVAESWAASGTRPDKIVTIPNAVDFERFKRTAASHAATIRSQLGLSPEDKILLWAGRLHREMKGLDRLVQIAKNLRSPWRLLVLGDGPDADWLLSELATCDRVTMAGLIQEPAPLFGMSDAFLFTSTTEPFGLVLLEAAASGLPIIAFPCAGGANEILDMVGAHRVDETSTESVEQMLNAAAYERLDLSAEQRTQFSWANNAMRTVEFYATR